MTLARTERAGICGEFERVGPDRPTLCEGWNARDLLAHLLVRERQPWAVSGMFVPFLAPVTDGAMRGYTAQPWSDAIALLRAGAPPWSPFRIGRVDEFGNAAEFFVHHEDLRRGVPGWEPREPDPVREAELWALLVRMGRVLHRHSPVGVVLRRPSGDEQVVKTGPGAVTIIGTPDELVLHAFGRAEVRVELEGSADDVERLAAAARGI